MKDLKTQQAEFNLFEKPVRKAQPKALSPAAACKGEFKLPACSAKRRGPEKKKRIKISKTKDKRNKKIALVVLILVIAGAVVGTIVVMTQGGDEEKEKSDKTPSRNNALDKSDKKGNNDGNNNGDNNNDDNNNDDNNTDDNNNGDNNNINNNNDDNNNANSGNTNGDENNNNSSSEQNSGKNGNTNSDNGNTNSDNGNTNSDNGNTNSDNGNTNSDNGNTNSDNGNSGNDSDENDNSNNNGQEQNSQKDKHHPTDEQKRTTVKMIKTTLKRTTEGRKTTTIPQRMQTPPQRPPTKPTRPPPPAPSSSYDCYRNGETYLYAGDVSTSQSGKQCIEWGAISQHIDQNPQLALFVDLGLFPDRSYQEVGNKCRAPTLGHIICFVEQDQGIATEPCNVPMCQGNIDYCNPDPCLSGGDCVNTYGAFRCDCHGTYSGNRCQISDCDNGNYMGNQAHSKSGKPCVNWWALSKALPEFGITLANFPDKSWETVQNRCRAVTGVGTQHVMCMVWSGKDNQFTGEACETPRCSGVGSNPQQPPSRPAPPLSSSYDCYRNGETYLYAGDVSTGQSGKQCIEWGAISQHIDQNPQLALFVDLGLFPDRSYQEVGNKCRAPILGHIICFVEQDQGIATEQCNVPVCQGNIDYCNPDPCLGGGDCVSANGGFRCDCHGTYSGNRCQIRDCDNGNYMGNQAHSESGKPCLNWWAVSEVSPDSGITLADFPDSSWDTVQNRCRAPFTNQDVVCLIWNGQDGSVITRVLVEYRAVRNLTEMLRREKNTLI